MSSGPDSSYPREILQQLTFEPKSISSRRLLTKGAMTSLVLLLTLGAALVEAAETEGQGLGRHQVLGLNALLGILILLGCLFLNHYLEVKHWHSVPHSIWALIIGFVVGGILFWIAKASGNEDLSIVVFDPDLAGFSLNKEGFFSNLGTIMLYAILGTLVSTFVVGFGLFACAKKGIVPLDSENPQESLLLGSLISATDPVAMLAVLSPRADSSKKRILLYNLVFGEAVLNDAVAIVLYEIMKELDPEKSPGATMVEATVSFFTVGFASVLLGVTLGLLVSWALKQSVTARSHPEWELLIIFFSSYAIYLVCDLSGLSGIMGLFCNGLVMGHYAMFNIDITSQNVAQYSFKAFAVFAEVSLYVYMGVSAIISFVNKEAGKVFPWSAALIFLTLTFCIVGRALHVPVNAWMANFKRTNKITFKMQFIMLWGGLRGAIAFALAQNVTTPNAEFVRTTTIAIVVITTVFFGSSSDLIMKAIKLDGDSPSSHDPVEETPATDRLHAHTEPTSDEWHEQKHNGLESPGSPGVENDESSHDGLRRRESRLGTGYKEISKIGNFTGVQGLSVVANLQQVDQELKNFEQARTRRGHSKALLTRFDQDYMQYVFGGPRYWLLGIAGRENERGPQDVPKDASNPARYFSPATVQGDNRQRLLDERAQVEMGGLAEDDHQYAEENKLHSEDLAASDVINSHNAPASHEGGTFYHAAPGLPRAPSGENQPAPAEQEVEVEAEISLE
eukprot:g3291.t1